MPVRLASVWIVLWAALAWAPFARAQITEVIDSTGGGIAPLNGPSALVVDGSGNLYVASSGSDRVFKLTPGGAVSVLIDATGDGIHQLRRPEDLALDSKGNLLVAGRWSQNVFEISPGGVIRQIIDATGDGAGNLMGAPTAVTVDTSDNVYVAAAGTNNAFKVTPGGTINQILVSAGSGSGMQFYSPSAIAVNAQGNVYVLASTPTGPIYQALVFAIAPGGAVTEILQSAGVSMRTGSDVEVDGAGTVYVAGSGEPRVVAIGPGGQVVDVLDAGGEGNCNPLIVPAKLAFDGLGNLYVTGASTFRIDPTGAVTTILDSAGDGAGNPIWGPWAVTAGPGGEVYVAGLYSSNVYRISAGYSFPPCAPVCGVSEVMDGATTPIGSMFPLALAVDMVGSLYVTDSWEVAYHVAPTGTVTQIIDSSGDGVHPLLGLWGIAVGSTGNVYVIGEGTSNAFKITPSGAITQIIDASGDGSHPFGQPTGIALDSAENVYVSGGGTDNVFKISPAGTITQVADQSGDGVHALLAPGELCVDGSDNLYVVGTDSANAFRIDPTGQVSQIIDITGDGTNPLVYPGHVAVDAAGNAFVSSLVTSSVFRISPSGAIVEVLDENGDGIHPFSGPTALAVRENGNALVGAGSDVYEVAVNGTISRIADVKGNGAGSFLLTSIDLAVGPGSGVYVAGRDSGNVLRIDGPMPSSYCTAGTSAGGCRAALSASGTASASAATGFALTAASVDGNAVGHFYLSTLGRQAKPWGNGTSFQCVTPPLVRLPLMGGSGTTGACDGSFTLDLNATWCPTCPYPLKNPGAGSVARVQLWYQGPGSPTSASASLSDALEFCLTP